MKPVFLLVLLSVTFTSVGHAGALKSARAPASEITCRQDGKNPDPRMPDSYGISVDDRGTLLMVDGQKATPLSEEKYKVDGQTFWYNADNKNPRLRRYDAAVGNVYWDCESR